MKTQLLTAAIISSFLTVSQTSQASDLSLAFSALQTAGRAPVQPVSTDTNTQTTEAAAPKLILGAYLDDATGKLQVTGTLPGSPASTTLQEGDVIRRIAVMGQPVRNVDSMIQFNYAKAIIGANRPVALEIVRPGTGVDYVWVTFSTDGRPATFNESTQTNAHSMFDNLNDSYVSR